LGFFKKDQGRLQKWNGARGKGNQRGGKAKLEKQAHGRPHKRKKRGEKKRQKVKRKKKKKKKQKLQREEGTDSHRETRSGANCARGKNDGLRKTSNGKRAWGKKSWRAGGDTSSDPSVRKAAMGGKKGKPPH